jgi:hypothetical protein
MFILPQIESPKTWQQQIELFSLAHTISTKHMGIDAGNR